jgi:CheY-like chemotaxis protein
MADSNKIGRSVPVIVIDDSDVDRQVMIELLSQGGIQVHGLATAIGATRIVRELGARVVVVDQNLPALDGAKLAALLRNNPSMKDVRLILVSSNDEQTMAELVRETRADAFVSKARMHGELVAAVRRLL